MSKRQWEPPTPELVSSDTICLLSTFLIGMSFGRWTGDQVAWGLLTCGLTGILAYFVFRLGDQHRRRRAALEVQQLMEQRLERHTFYLAGGTADPVWQRHSADVDLISI